MRRFLALLALLPALAKPAASQLPSLTGSPTPTPETTAGDPFRRETPRSSLLGFISAAQKGNWSLATEFLQATGSAGEAAREALAKQLEAVLNQAFTGDIQKLSASPLGDVADGLPPDLERVGPIVVGDESVDLLLVRKTPPEGPAVWLVSSQTLREIPRLYRELGVPQIEEKLPEALRRPLGLLHVWQLLGFFVLLPLLYVLARVVLSMAVKPLRARLEKSGRQGHFREALKRARTPLAVLLTLVLHRLAVPYLSLSLLFRYRYGLWFSVSVVAVSAWLFLRLIDSLSGATHDRFAAAGSTAVPMITLGRGILKGLVWVAAALVALSVFGVNLTAALAGVGIGGVALAFAAKTSIENIFGGFTVLGDKILRVGDACRIGTYIGTVEDITLFATRLRTPERAIVSIPNGTLLTREIENLSSRDRFLFTHVLGLRYETSPAQLKTVLEAVRKLLADHQRVAPEDARVRFLRFGASSLDLELRAYVLAADFPAFLAIQEELLLSVMEIVAASGTSLAFPSQTLYLGRDVPPSPPPGPTVPPGG
ncbi:MAG: mechanosensitive ion channel family protein [Acidithiobacillales bacterium]